MENQKNIISDEDFLNQILGTDVTTDEKLKSNSEEVLDDILGIKDELVKEESAVEKETSVQEEPLKVEEPKISRFGVKDTVLTLIESGEWYDMPIKYGEKEYENIEELIEKEKPSKELFQLLSQAQKTYKESLIEESYVKVGDKTSTKAKLISAILNDVDYSDLLEHNRDVIEPLKKVDFNTIQDNERIAEGFVRQCLVEVDNYHPDSLDVVIAKLKSEHRLIEQATAYQEEYVERFNREVEKRQIEKNTIKQQEEQALKEDMKNLRATLKTLDFNDKFSGEILKLRYNKDEAGKYRYESLVKDKMSKDKEFEARLMHFIIDEQDFIEKAKSKVKAQEQKKVLELLNLTPRSKTSVETKLKSGNLQTEDEDFLRELGLFGAHN